MDTPPQLTFLMVDFIMLQMVMPILLVTFIVYPLPRRAYTSSEYLAIAVEFINAFDIMDMVGDFQFVKHYGIGWEIVYYLSLGTSVILVAFPIKIENEGMVWPATFIVSSQSSFNISCQNGASMTSIIDAPIVFETDRTVERIHYLNSVGESTTTVARKHNVQNFFDTIRASSMPNLYKISNSISPSVTMETDVSTTRGSNVKANNGTNNISPLSVERFSTELKNIPNLDEEVDEETQKTYRKILKVLLTLVFTDVMFATLRFKIMMKENSAEYGFNMFIKNVILACLHLSYLLQHLKRLVVTKLSRDLY